MIYEIEQDESAIQINDAKTNIRNPFRQQERATFAEAPSREGKVPAGSVSALALLSRRIFILDICNLRGETISSRFIVSHSATEADCQNELPRHCVVI